MCIVCDNLSVNKYYNLKKSKNLLFQYISTYKKSLLQDMEVFKTMRRSGKHKTWRINYDI